MMSKIHDFVENNDNIYAIMNTNNLKLVTLTNTINETETEKIRTLYYAKKIGIGFSDEITITNDNNIVVNTIDLANYLQERYGYGIHINSSVTISHQEETIWFLGEYSTVTQNIRISLHILKEIKGRKRYSYNRTIEHAIRKQFQLSNDNGDNGTWWPISVLSGYDWKELLNNNTPIESLHTINQFGNGREVYGFSFGYFYKKPIIGYDEEEVMGTVWEDAEESPDGMRMIPGGYREMMVTKSTPIYGEAEEVSLEDIPDGYGWKLKKIKEVFTEFANHDEFYNSYIEHYNINPNYKQDAIRLYNKWQNSRAFNYDNHIEKYQ